MSSEVMKAKKTVQGLVVSNKMDKTVRVQLTRRFMHPMYKKYVTRKKTFMAHDETNECRTGDTVQIEETRPLSRNKCWRVKAIIVRAE